MDTDNLNLHIVPSKKTKKIKIKELIKDIKVQKATFDDVEGIYGVASSVGKSKKESYDGFLMDNYASKPKKYKTFFKERIKELEYFYVAKSHGKILGFLMGYTRDEWLKYNPTWIEDIHWSPVFDLKKTEKFVLTDKIAINSNFTGNGIGSIIYNQYMKDLKRDGIYNIFSETLVGPTPNFASLAFRKKQKFTLVGTRFEEYEGKLYTDLIYYKPVK